MQLTVEQDVGFDRVLSRTSGSNADGAAQHYVCVASQLRCRWHIAFQRSRSARDPERRLRLSSRFLLYLVVSLQPRSRLPVPRSRSAHGHRHRTRAATRCVR
jgi:hypothetical protein